MRKRSLTNLMLFSGACFAFLPLSGTLAAPGLQAVRSDILASMAAYRLASRVAASDTALTVTLVLPLRDRDGAAAFARGVSTPHDRLSGRYLTPVEFADRFGPSRSDYDAVVTWAKSMGLSIHEASLGRSTLAVSAPAATLGRVFNVSFANYVRPDGSVFPSASGQPRIQADIAAKLLGVVGLSKRTQYAPLVQRRPAMAVSPQAGTGVGGGYAPADLRRAYNPPLPYIHRSKETVAVFEQGGFNKGDVAVYAKRNNLIAPPVLVRSVDGYGGGVDDPNVELEAVLDIDTVFGVNPTIGQVLVYEDGLDFSTALLNALAAMATDNTAKIISISYGLDEAYVSTTAMDAENQVFIQLAAQGQSVCVSSGDEGAYGVSQYGLNVEDPGSQPFVTSIGGTDLYTAADGTWLSEETWNDLGHYGGASGGGVSSYWTLPAYQLQPGEQGISVAHVNGGSDTMRNVPDVAAVGGPLTGAAIYSGINGGWLTIGGTSLSAPVYAGVLSIYDQLRNASGLGHVGLYNPALYQLGTSLGGYYSFHDVRDGTNGNLGFYGIPGYNAGFNFDDVSGWGTPNGTIMLFDLLVNAQSGTPPSPPSGVTGHVAHHDATLRWTAPPGVSGYGITVYDAYTGALLTSGFTKGTKIVFSGLPGSGAYAFYVASLTPGGSTYAPAIYLK